MATLAELLCPNVKTCDVLDAENMNLFMLFLGISNKKAIELLELNGRGCVYSAQGDTAKDWELMGAELPELRGKCVFVSLGGKVTPFSKREHKMRVRAKKAKFLKEEFEREMTPEAVGKRYRETIERIKSEREETARKMREREIRMRERETHRIFKEGQTMPSPKRQGTGKSLEEMGKFISRPAVRVNIDSTTHCKITFGF